MSDRYIQTSSLMGTVVTIEVVGHGATSTQHQERADAVTRAFDWFHHVESICSRFDPTSELCQLTSHVGEAIAVSATLFHALTFACAVAKESGGAFDPTVGRRMEMLGFNRDYRSGAEVVSDIALSDASYRDVLLDAQARTVTLTRPLVLDLGAVAKGLAVDMAARELQPFGDFAIDAGGDMYMGGHNAHDMPWSVGIRHPRDAGATIGTMQVSDGAVCTSGDYERRGMADANSGNERHHLVDGRDGSTAADLASVTVLAPSAMVADALATAAFVLGRSAGASLLERHGVNALLITPTLDRLTLGATAYE